MNSRCTRGRFRLGRADYVFAAFMAAMFALLGRQPANGRCARCGLSGVEDGVMTALRLVTMSDAALMVRRINRRAAARRLAELVQSGAVLADDYRVLTDHEDDIVAEAARALALRARGLRGTQRADNTVRGIIELDGDVELWAAKAGPVLH